MTCSVMGQMLMYESVSTVATGNPGNHVGVGDILFTYVKTILFCSYTVPPTRRRRLIKTPRLKILSTTILNQVCT